MRPHIKLFTFLAIVFVSTASFRWPVDQGMITSTFCESRWDHFHDGIDMVAPGNTVYPVDAGALFFYWDRAIFPLDNYPGGGNYKVLQHRGGLYSVYMHLENGVSSKPKYAAGDPVGIMGNTGHSMKKHVHFTILNINRKSSINPFKLLPGLPDNRQPDIREVAFKIGDKYVIVRDKSNIRLTRHYPLLVKIVDSASGTESLGVYSLSVLFNGREVLKYKCDELSFSNGKLNINKRGFDALFDKKGYYKVEGLVYAEGENTLKITASDYAGNRTEKDYSFNVKLDMAR